MEVPVLLGQRIRELRSNKGETLKETSQGTNLSVSYLSDIERGRTNPSLQTLELLAKHFGLSMNDLLSGVEMAGPITERSRPPGLQELLDDDDFGQEIDQGWIDLLGKISLRGNRPQTKKDWLELYLNLKRILEPPGV